MGAAEKAHKDAVRAIYEFGEVGWNDLLRPIAQEAIEQADNDTWINVHSFAAFLRRVGGLATIGGSETLHKYARPDLVRWWRLQNARRADVRSTWQVGDVVFVERIPVEAPRVTAGILQVHREWGPGLYTADEVIANVREVKRIQTEEIEKAQAWAEKMRKSRRVGTTVGTR